MPGVTEALAVGAGFAGYAANRMVSRIAHSQASARSPKAGKHVAAAASVLGAIGAYYVAGRWERLRPHRESVAVGAGIAALQTLVQAYAPAKYAWLVCDFHEESAKTGAKAAPTAQTPPVDQLEGVDLDRLLAENPEVEAVPLDSPADDGLGDFSDAHDDELDDVGADVVDMQAWR